MTGLSPLRPLLVRSTDADDLLTEQAEAVDEALDEGQPGM